MRKPQVGHGYRDAMATPYTEDEVNDLTAHIESLLGGPLRDHALKDDPEFGCITVLRLIATVRALQDAVDRKDAQRNRASVTAFKTVGTVLCVGSPMACTTLPIDEPYAAGFGLFVFGVIFFVIGRLME